MTGTIATIGGTVGVLLRLLMTEGTVRAAEATTVPVRDPILLVSSILISQMLSMVLFGW